MLTSDISVIIQGKFNNDITLAVINSVKKHLPGAQIILSVWKGCNPFNVQCDVILHNEDPGSAIYNPSNNTPNNVNRQIVQQ